MMQASTNSTQRVPVVIVGAGPTGLTLSLCLSRLGVDHVIVERHETTAVHPQAHVVNTRTMEILRHLGLSDAVSAESLPLDQFGIRMVESVCGTELANLGPDQRMLDEAGLAELVALDVATRAEPGKPSPERVTSCAQDRIELHLLDAARRHPHADIRFSTTCTGVQEVDDGVIVTLESNGESYAVHADWVVGADGTRSRVRDQIGVTMEGDVELGTLLNVYVECPALIDRIRDNPALLYFIVRDDMMGAVINMNGRGRWIVNFVWDPTTETLDDYPLERCREIVNRAFGTDDLQMEVKSVLPWRMTGLVADGYQRGRVLLAGDAVHAFPPTGGFGMNSGIQDAHNLAWKLAAVLDGRADESLIDTYEAERRPVAQFNCEQSIRNAKGEGGSDHFFHLGQDLGFRYVGSPAVISDGAEPPPFDVSTYTPSCVPGVRMPHVWLDEGAISTLDLVGDRFVLMVPAGPGGERWAAATPQSPPVHIVTIGTGGDHEDTTGDWAELAGIGLDGALLIRPDGHVGWRTNIAADDPTSTLADVLGEILHPPATVRSAP